MQVFDGLAGAAVSFDFEPIDTGYRQCGGVPLKQSRNFRIAGSHRCLTGSAEVTSREVSVARGLAYFREATASAARNPFMAIFVSLASVSFPRSASV